MSDIKPPMSLAYKAVFAFAILMMLLALLGGSKSGIGVLLWGYVAWLMHKRKNQVLITVFKTLLWFEVVVGGVGFLVLFFNVDDGSAIFAYAAIIMLIIAISFAMIQFFKKQLGLMGELRATTLSSNNSSSFHQKLENQEQSVFSSDEVWESALKELDSNKRNEGLWAKCFAECNGDEGKARAMYLKEAVGRLNSKASISEPLRVSNVTIVRKPNAVLGLDIFTIETEAKISDVDYSQFSMATLLRSGMFERKKFKDRTLFYLHNGNVACVSGQLIKVFDTDSFAKKAIEKGAIGERYPSGLIVSFDKDTIK